MNPALLAVTCISLCKQGKNVAWASHSQTCSADLNT